MITIGRVPDIMMLKGLGKFVCRYIGCIYSVI